MGAWFGVCQKALRAKNVQIKRRTKQVYKILRPSASPIIVLVAGGTGGHVFPAWAVAEELMQKKYRVIWITEKRGASYPKKTPLFHHVYILPFEGLHGSWAQKSARACLWGAGFFYCLFLFARHRPKVVWGFGAYPSVVPLMAAWVLCIPMGIYEADAYAGKANRMLSYFTPHAATAFPSPRNLLCKAPRHTGVCFSSCNITAPLPYPQRLSGDPLNILVLGGSQGSSVWSHVLPQALQTLSPQEQALLAITQQTRPELMASTQNSFRKTLSSFFLTPFIQDIPGALAQSHVVFSRAGAGTLLEAASLGRPLLCVPHPSCAHQRWNGKAIEECGGGWMVLEKDLTPCFLRSLLRDFLAHPTILENAQTAIQQQGTLQGAQKLACFIESCGVS